MQIISKEDIEKFYTMSDCLKAVRDAFFLFSEGKVDVPLRTQINNEEGTGTYLCMPAYSKEYDASCVKILNMFPGNLAKGIPSINAQILVMNTQTGMIEATFDGTYVTQLRTGAASGVAFDLLAKETCVIGALIGTGGQAAAQLEAMLEVRNLKEVRVTSLNFEHAKEFVLDMSFKFSKYNTKIIAVETSDEAIIDADLIIAVTPSKIPVFDGTKVKAGATVSGVGSYQPDMQEIPSELFQRTTKFILTQKKQFFQKLVIY